MHIVIKWMGEGTGWPPVEIEYGKIISVFCTWIRVAKNDPPRLLLMWKPRDDLYITFEQYKLAYIDEFVVHWTSNPICSELFEIKNNGKTIGSLIRKYNINFERKMCFASLGFIDS